MRLYAKELRALVPMMVLCFLTVSGDLLSRPFTERLDEASWESISAIEPGTGGAFAFFFGLLAFTVAYAAFPREHDEGTIDWLGSLPVARSRIFATKVAAGASVLVGSIFVGQLTNWLLQLPNPQSFSGHQFRPGVALAIAGLQSVLVLVLYAHGLLASAFRTFGILFYTLVAWTVLVAGEIEPGLDWVSPAAICRLAYEGSRITVPWWPIAAHSVLALLVAALSYAAWMGPFDGLRERFSARGGRSVAMTAALGCTTIGVALASFVLLVVWAVTRMGHGPPELEPHDEVVWSTAVARSERYVFVYPTNLRDRALRLVADADAIQERERALLGAADPGIVTVDLAEVSAHHEGITAGTRIRMGLTGEDETHLRYVLAHETAHVLQGRESDRRLVDQGMATRLFIEGGADWIAYEVVPGLEEARRQSRIVAAASWERHRLEPEDLLDEARLHARWDTTLAYSIGETWTEAVAAACGREAVGGVLRAIGRADAPEDPGVVGLWQDALQHVGCSDAAVRERWERAMAETVAAERAAIDAIPRAGVGITGEGEDGALALAVLDRPSPPGARWFAALRRDASASDAELRGARGQLDGLEARFVLPHPAAWERYEIQVCVTPAEGHWPFCEAWQPVP